VLAEGRLSRSAGHSGYKLAGDVGGLLSLRLPQIKDPARRGTCASDPGRC